MQYMICSSAGSDEVSAQMPSEKVPVSSVLACRIAACRGADFSVTGRGRPAQSEEEHYRRN